MSRYIEITENPVPANAEVGTFTASDGANLRTSFYPVENAVGTIVVLTGWAEFIEKYFEVADDLRKRRLNVAMMDWRGQGLSDRPENWQGYFNQLVDDLRRFREGPVAERFGGPYYLLTHSMGGLPSLLLLAQGYTGFERAALCAPMTRMFEGAQNTVINFVATAASYLGAANQGAVRGKDDSQIFDGNMYSTDETRHTRFRRLQETAPEAVSSSPTYGWIRDAIAASAKIHQPGFFDNLQTPVRIISAGAERRIDGSDHAVVAAMSDKIELVAIEGALHEIMMEADRYRDAFFASIDEFFSFSAE